MNEIIVSSIKPQEAGFKNALDWFDISDEDRARVADLRPIVEATIDAVLDDFQAHTRDFDEASDRNLTASDRGLVRDEQRRHFLELVDVGLDPEYFRNRTGTGQFNERLGLAPMYYLGGYSFFLRRMVSEILTRMPDQQAALDTILSLQKVASCHKAITLDIYTSAREQAIEDRERQMSELPTPVLRLREGLLLVPVVGTLDSHRARLLTIQMLEAIREKDARAVVLDITGVAAVDSAVANHLIQTMTAARLMGAQCVLTGISAEVAQALVKIGVTGEALNPAGDLERGIATALRIVGS